MARRMRAGPSGYAVVHFQPFGPACGGVRRTEPGRVGAGESGLERLGPARRSEELLRKAAHFAEFTALGWWLLLCARAFAARVARRLPWLWGAGILCAAADEGIQLFVPGRSARISDVLLDGCGVLAGLVLARAAIWAWTRLHGRAEQRK